MNVDTGRTPPVTATLDQPKPPILAIDGKTVYNPLYNVASGVIAQMRNHVKEVLKQWSKK